MAGTDLFPVAGCRFFIGGVLATKSTDFIASDFSGQTWVEVDGYEQMGGGGDASALITTPLINRNRDVKQKGTFNAPSRQEQFALLANDPGQIALIAASKTRNNYAFRVDLNDAPVVDSDPVTVTIASPGVFTDTAHGLIAGDAVVYSTTGALPTGLTAATTYYVVSSGLTTNAYSVAATKGGSAIVTTGSQSGVHTRTTVPSPSQRFFVGLVMSATEAGGNANTTRMLNATIEVNSNYVPVAAAA